jgi:hypothetical protein
MQLSGGILKKSNVLMGQPVMLAGPAPAPGPRKGSAVGEDVKARARLVSRASDHAIIEVICPCGQQIELRCDFGPSAEDGGST